jgi:hypothetical protein
MFTDVLNALETMGLEGDIARPCKASSNFTLRLKVIEHANFTAAVREIARLHRRGREAGVAEGLLLVAQTGSGKSTLVKFYRQRFPHRVENGVTRIPVLAVDTPEYPSVRELAETILQALGDPASEKGSAAFKTRRIVRLFKECGVEVLFIDEFQHFFDGRHVAESLRVSNWLKTLINKVRIPVILVGLPRSIGVTNINPQLRRRFAAPHYLMPFGFSTEEERIEFRSVLKSIQAAVPVGTVPLESYEIAQRFYFASHGLIDYVVKIVDDAVSRGGSGDECSITLDDYAKAFKRTVWSTVPDELNPFHPAAKLRLLTRQREPFDIWDDISNYTATSSQMKGRRRQ